MFMSACIREKKDKRPSPLPRKQAEISGLVWHPSLSHPKVMLLRSSASRTRQKDTWQDG